SDDVYQAILIGQFNGFLAAGIKADRSFAMQVIHRVVQKKTAVRDLFHVKDRIQADLHFPGAPQRIEFDRIGVNTGFEVNYEQENDRDHRDGNAHDQQELGIAPFLFQKVYEETKSGKYQTPADPIAIETQVLFFPVQNVVFNVC